MRKTMLFAGAALIVAACAEETTAPSADLFEAETVLAFDASGEAGPGHHLVAVLQRLPENLRLSAEQRTQIRTLLEAFGSATRADRDALKAIHQQARAAREAGKSREEIRQILEQGRPIVERLNAAEAELRTDIEAILTPAQKAWIAAHTRTRCDRANAPPLTDAQKTEIQALIAAFEDANRADLETVKSALERARDAHRNGAPRAQIKAILDEARPAMNRLHAATRQLHAAIDAVLTAEQRASGCYNGPRR